MAKDQNTFAKKQREVAKKHKAELKRQRRAQKKRDTIDSLSEHTPTMLSSEERSVLALFKEYLMTPGKMLRFGSSDLNHFSIALNRLIHKGLLLSEKREGAFSLSDAGYAVMNKHL